MAREPIFDGEDKDEIVKDFEKNEMSIAQIAKERHVSYALIRNMLVAAGCDTSRKPPAVPKATVIYRDIRKRIISGEWKEGEKLPSRMQLSDSYKVGTSTIQEALYDLANDGYISTLRGIGTWVKGRKYWPDNDSTQRYGRIVGGTVKSE